MELWFEWEENNEEHLSFDDSDRFEEDSLCSWVSEPESLCGNWRGWKRNSQNGVQFGSDLGEGTVETLIEICARTVAEHFPFETVECKFPQIPEQLQQRLAFCQRLMTILWGCMAPPRMHQGVLCLLR